MTCKTERGATGARPTVPAPIDLADVVTLANDAHATPLTVLAVLPETTLQTRYFVRGYDVAGQVTERVVTRLEIATAKRIAPVRVTGPDGRPVEIAKPFGMGDFLADIMASIAKGAASPASAAAPKPAAEPQAAAQPKPASKLVWLPPDSRGESSTHCKRFAVLKTAEGMFRGVDQRSSKPQHSVRFTFPDSARQWCEDQFDLAGDGPGGPPVVAPAPVANSSGLEWISNGADKQGRPTAWASKCGRFNIWRTVEKDGTHEGVWYAVDLVTTITDCGVGGTVGPADELTRFSPNGSLDDVKEWCEDRSRFVKGTNAKGEPCLVPVGQESGAATKAEEPVLPVDVVDWTSPAGL
ncbi:unnamed protein product [Gemmataceae bacterium]|nr:unnamed protein product [Gemmataceae bacterium]VTU01036.1 unnamed protein product [Gemmataceae bacterium]